MPTVHAKAYPDRVQVAMPSGVLDRLQKLADDQMLSRPEYLRHLLMRTIAAEERKAQRTRAPQRQA